jgi:hypothetical protein
MVLSSKVFKGGDKGRTIASNDFSKGPPSTDEVLEDPITKSLCILFAKHPKFWVIDE